MLSSHLRQRMGGLIPHVILLAYILLALFPIFLIVINSFKARKAIFGMPYQLPGSETFSLIGYETVFSRASFQQYFVNSLVVTVVSLATILFIGAMAAFALSENTAAFLPVLQQAILRRGVPKRLYVDNGAAYRSNHLSLVCAKLGITLIHARPYQPQAKGKQERWFRTVRMQLLPALTEADTRSLDALNRRLWAWIEAEYHMSPHRGLDGATPLDRWMMAARNVRLVDPDCDLDELFLFEEKRKVQRDRTVSLHGVVYEVDASLVGETVTLRFDPSRRGRPVDVYFKGRKIEQAKRVDLYANCFVRRDHTTKALQPDKRLDDPPTGLSLRNLKREEE